MSEHRDIHVHVERDEPAYERDSIAEEGAARSFFTAQVLWIALLVLLVVLIIVALSGSVVDFNGASDPVNPTAVP